MLVNRFYWRVLVALICCLTATAQAEVSPSVKAIDPPDRVFFIGNSFSYYNNGIATHYSALISTSGLWKKGQTGHRQKTISGGRLSEHLAGLDELLSIPQGKNWDVVVLQEYSNGPIKDSSAEGFRAASSEMAAIIRQHQAKPVFFMTWAYNGDPQMTRQLRDAYVAQGNKLDMLVVPVGLAFAAAQQQYPGIELYSKDVAGVDAQGQVLYAAIEKHPSLAGSYLAACVFYASLRGKSPVGISYTAGLDPEQARQLQEIAWQSTQQFYQ